VKKPLIRTNVEIENIKKACRVTDSGFKYVLGQLKAGITEEQLAKKLSIFLKSHSDSLSFRTIVAFGENSSTVHHRPTSRKLKINDVVLLDFGAKLNGVCSDLSRTVFFGKVNSKQKRVYLTVLKAQEKAIAYLKLRITNLKSCKAKNVDKVARNYIISKGFLSIPHGLGHAIGRKVHQSPRLSPRSKYYLKPGMIVTIEPGIYLKEFGIRIEDDVLIKQGDIEVLTTSKKTLIEKKDFS
jgi:Xaa-Pro aminopeptidase